MFPWIKENSFTKQARLSIEEVTGGRKITCLLEKLKAGKNFMNTLNLKIAKALTNIYEMQEEAADWNRLYDNFNILNYCCVDSVGTLRLCVFSGMTSHR
jgi:hypothetical protein